MILHLQCAPLLAISAACDPDSARAPFIPPNPFWVTTIGSPSHCLRGQRVGSQLGKQNRICDGLKSDDYSAQRGLILWMSGSGRPDDHPRFVDWSRASFDSGAPKGELRWTGAYVRAAV